MKSIAFGLAIVTALVSFEAAADCTMPTYIADIPDGATAREAELLTAQAAIRSYIAAMDEYIACQNEELRVDGQGATSQYLFQMASRIEFARDEVDGVATRFNDAVEAFRAARPPANNAPAQTPQSQFPPPQQGLAPGR